MKQAVLVAIVAIAVQDAAAADLGFTLNAGSNTSWAEVTGPAAFDTEAATDLVAGLGVSVPLGDRFSLEPELLYAKLRFSSKSFDPEIQVSAQAFLVPVLFMLHWNRDASLSPHVTAGPQLVFVDRAEQTVEGLETDVSDLVHDLDVELVIGAGVGIRAGRGRATVELRYAIGLRNLDTTGNDLKIRSVQALVGYRF
jgi:hypothetical protein